MFQNHLLHRTSQFYGFFVRFGTKLQSLFLLYMRLTWGHQLCLVGMAKFAHIQQVAQFFASLHIGYPLFSAYLVATCETVCGMLFVLGLASRLAAIPILIILLTALSTAHAPHLSHFRFLFDPVTLVAEGPYPFLITALLVFFFGPGKISLDGWIKRWVGRQPKY